MTTAASAFASPPRAVDRRRFLFATATGLLAASVGARSATAATDDDLAYANFGLASSYLLADFYGRALQSGRLGSAVRPTLRRGRSVSTLQARALTDLLTGAGDTPATADDFTFEWPAGSFATAATTRRTGLTVLDAVLGAYQTASATLSESSYRVLFASLAASVAEQAGAFAPSGTGVEPFPTALDLEAASAALEAYLG
jgi:ferritin-like protein